MEENKICFILCYNDERALEECLFYLGQLYIPENYKTELLTVCEAVSMCAGYNEAMYSSTAKYKVYLHQDVYILNRFFLYDILQIFLANPIIGMIGMVGPKRIPEDGVIWHTKEYGNLYDRSCTNTDYEQYRWSVEDGVGEVAAIDGFLMATAYDIPWREDLFDGWDFYDVSQSIEFRKRGYRIVVPSQREPWCLHDDGRVLSLWNYNKYRHIFFEEYKWFLQNDSRE